MLLAILMSDGDGVGVAVGGGRAGEGGGREKEDDRDLIRTTKMLLACQYDMQRMRRGGC